MAKSKNARRAAAKAAASIHAAAQATATMAPSVAADLERRRSGAAGAHSDSKARTLRAAGRTNRVGSRSAQRGAAIRDHA
jgi:hypothetical protein